MTEFSDLQIDLVGEILSRVPLKFMRAVRLTCKKWNTLPKNQNFSKMQIDKEKAGTKEGESQMIVMRDQNLYLMSVINNGDPYIELKGTLTCLNEQLFKGSQILNCEGLLLCIFKDENSKLMVWNPYCLQPKWFEPRCSYKIFWYGDHCYYALGYAENSCGRSHKILRFKDNISFRDDLEEGFSWYEIYNLESDSWKTLSIRLIRFNEHGVSVKGNTYWCVREENEDNFHILCFDFTRQFRKALM